MAAVALCHDRVVKWKALPGTGSEASVLGYLPNDMGKSSNVSPITPPLLVRDPDSFLAGEIHQHCHAWDRLTESLPNRDKIMGWITKRVSVGNFIQPFNGRFGGCTYASDYPEPRLFPNHNSCQPFVDFISQTIMDRIAVGAVGVVGKVGQCPPPSIVMPLTVEPNKPRLCQDQRYLNCWMKDMPFRLDSLADLTRYVYKNHFQSKLDDKSGYDHVLMDEESRRLMGFQWGGWWFINNVLPFGWKISPYIYQSLGLVATQEIRNQGIPCSQYIDDRHLGQLRPSSQAHFHHTTQPPHDNSITGDLQLAIAANCIAVSTLTSLGYFLNLSKSVFTPVQKIIFLGLCSDSTLPAFSLPRDKIQKFATLRELILSQQSVPLVCLQKLIGKCISFSLVVPAAKLFTREMNLALSKALKSKKSIQITGCLRSEITYWRFLDAWEGHMTWRDERHVTLTLASDASGSGWGGALLDDAGHTLKEVGDSWCEPLLSSPIHVRETTALSHTLLALGDLVKDRRVDVLVDSKVLLGCWERQYSSSHAMLEALKHLFWTTVKLNVAISLRYVKSADNPADAPSRRLSLTDCALAPRLWRIAQRVFGGPGGHTCDLMALDSNAQCGHDGNPLPHFAPVPTPEALGVNIFAHRITWLEGSVFESCYVFPPFQLMGPVLKFLREQKARCTIIIADRFPRPYWWPILQFECSSKLRLAVQGDVDVLLRPSKNGFVNYGPIPWDLWAFRVCFDGY